MSTSPPTVYGLEALPSDVPRPTDAVLHSFWRAVQIARPDLTLPDNFEVCCLGGDRAGVDVTLQDILNGMKSATFRVPSVLKARGQRVPETGNVIVLIDWSGAPRVAFRYTTIEETTFGKVSEHHTRHEGPPYDKLEMWNSAHRGFWSRELARHNLAFSDDVTLLVGHFDVIYPQPLDKPVPRELHT